MGNDKILYNNSTGNFELLRFGDVILLNFIGLVEKVPWVTKRVFENHSFNFRIKRAISMNQYRKY